MLPSWVYVKDEKRINNFRGPLKGKEIHKEIEKEWPGQVSSVPDVRGSQASQREWLIMSDVTKVKLDTYCLKNTIGFSSQECADLDQSSCSSPGGQNLHAMRGWLHDHRGSWDSKFSIEVSILLSCVVFLTFIAEKFP